MNLPHEHRNQKMTKEKQQLAWKLQNIQKNIVLKRVFEIQLEKAKPGLKEAIQISLKQKAIRDAKIRKKLKKKVMELYEKEIAHNLSEEDKQFTRIVLQIDRLHKILSSQAA